MEKLRMQSPDGVSDNMRYIAERFPNCMTETKDEHGKSIQVIDFDQLRQELSKDIVEGPEERYQFTWPDKRNAIRLANTPTTDTLRPCREESVDFDNTQNLYIEGDNLEVLKLLREDYLGKVKMIYIDPPYNTGNDFIYNDDFAQKSDEYFHNSGQEDEEGNRLVTNAESNGRFHTDWLNMIYPRLKVVRDLLTDDGVIFISIDDNEIENLKKVCSEIFGESNFVGCIIRATGTTTAQGTDSLGKSFDYILVYSKQTDFVVGGIDLSDKDIARYSFEDEKGKYSILQLRRTGGEDRREDRPSMFYGIKAPDNSIIYPYGPTGYESRWRVGEETFKTMLSNNEIYFKQSENGYGVYYKFYLEGRTKRPSNLWTDVEGNKKAQIDLKKLIPEKVFDTPKPIEVISLLSKVANCNRNSIILDFFSGSATTAHAVIQLNSEDGGNRKFIMVQLPEPTDEKSEAYKAGYKNICEIGKERIRRAGKKIKEELAKPIEEFNKNIDYLAGQRSLVDNDFWTTPQKLEDKIKSVTQQKEEIENKITSLDTGFRVLKLDSSNMNDVYYTPSDFSEKTLFDENIKTDRTDEDLLFQTMLDLGIELSAKTEKKQIAGKDVFVVSDGYLIACFDTKVNEEVIKEIAKLKPYYFVMRDSSLEKDNVADNFDQIFDEYSKDTIRKIL